MTGPEQARQDLTEVLSAGRLKMSEAQALMAERGHPPGRVDRARRALQVETVRTGAPGSKQVFFWRMPTSCPTCMRPFSPDPVHEPTAWRRNQADIGDYWTGESHSIEPPPQELDVTPHLEPYHPPVCDRCGRTSAMDRGQLCPWRPTGGALCGGTMR